MVGSWALNISPHVKPSIVSDYGRTRNFLRLPIWSNRNNYPLAVSDHADNLTPTVDASNLYQIANNKISPIMTHCVNTLSGYFLAK